MDTKEAIVETIIQHLKINIENNIDNEYDEDIISLLQEGEKYKKMWEELKDQSTVPYYKSLLSDLEQKYIPQPVKKVITIEVEAKDEKCFEWFKKYIGEVNDIIGKNSVKVNIKEETNAN